MKPKDKEYAAGLEAMTDEQLMKEAQKNLVEEVHWKLDLIVDECEQRKKPHIIDEVYIWYSLGT
ncbi:hypothetical protein [Paenibacillus gansuensis]|uniref:Transposase n=1 Tax=Paenibacillus gansuensis TaxID=306542 RepID=A0ABW5PAL9_9BACL